MSVALSQLSGGERRAMHGMLELDHFTELLHVHFIASSSREDAECDLLLQTADAAPKFRLRLHFSGVRRFAFYQQDIDCAVAVKLIINDIKDRQWDGVQYQVKEDERGAISFFCASAMVRSIEPVPVV